MKITLAKYRKRLYNTRYSGFADDRPVYIVFRLRTGRQIYTGFFYAKHISRHKMS